MAEWEKVAEFIQRMKVPGGWIYKYHQYGIGVSMVFVPAPIEVERG